MQARLVDRASQHIGLDPGIAHRPDCATLVCVGYVGAWAAALALAAAACSAPAPTVPNIRPQVLAQLPHETTSFTEGLQRDGTALYESTGLAGESTLRELDPATGAVRRSEPLPGQLWGEGIAVDAGGNAYIAGYTASLNFPAVFLP